jgi:PQQ-dependent dehydrogenase (methanol/ethanol family)
MRVRIRAGAVAAVALACAIPMTAALASGVAGTSGLARTTRPARTHSTKPVPIQPSQCCAATSANDPKLGGDYGDQDYSSLASITTANVRYLRGTWVDSLDDTLVNVAQESTPVAIGGNLYVQTGQGDIFAVNGATGKVLWEYSSGFTGTERGVAAGTIGSTPVIFSALGSEHVVALNEQTGALIWQVQVGTPGQDTTVQGASTPWTLYYKGLVFVGTENGGGSGMRGHIYALNASNGSVAWDFASTAAPGQPGGKTWSGDSYELGGGDVWMPPAVDPGLGLIYVTLANPEPRTDGLARAGNNLYTNSVVALRWNTGDLVWHFQSVHHDLWDYDNEMPPVIAKVRYGSTEQQVVVYGSKTSWLYYLNAATGKPVVKVQEESVPTMPSLASSPTQPIPAGDSLSPTCPEKTGPTQVIPGYQKGCEFAPFGSTPVMVTPGRGGGGNWAPLSFDQQNGLLYDAVSEVDTAYSSGEPYGQPTFFAPSGELRAGLLDAINPQTNKIVWQRTTRYPQSNGDGILTTAGGLLFEGAPGGLFYARSASSGKVLWTWQTGAGISDTPTTYSVGKTQYVAIFACANSVPCNLWAFKINGALHQAHAPGQPSIRQGISAPTVAGSTVADTVVLGQTWDSSTGAPSGTENLSSVNAMAPTVMTVPAGTTVTFENPSTNSNDHCAQSFFDPAAFKVGPLAPGTSGSFTFTKPGTYYYNDCAGFPWDTGEIVVSQAS